MSSIFSAESNQAKFCGRIVHPVKQCLTRWAKNPNLFQRRICSVSVRTITSMLRSMRNVQNAGLTTRLTFSRCLRMTGIKSLQVAVRPKFLSGFRIVLARLMRLLHIEIRAGFTSALHSACIRAVPLIAFAPPIREELCSALAAMAPYAQQLARLFIIPEFLLTGEGAELLPGSRRFKSRAALAAMFGAIHV